jgi:hypothetical protein
MLPWGAPSGDPDHRDLVYLSVGHRRRVRALPLPGHRQQIGQAPGPFDRKRDVDMSATARSSNSSRPDSTSMNHAPTHQCLAATPG